MAPGLGGKLGLDDEPRGNAKPKRVRRRRVGGMQLGRVLTFLRIADIVPAARRLTKRTYKRVARRAGCLPFFNLRPDSR